MSEISFPHPLYCDTDCISIGGELSVERLRFAYSLGIFPWYNEGEEVHWYCPDPRFVLYPSEVVVSKSMRRYFNQDIYTITYNKCFDTVIDLCQSISRAGQAGTWITSAMKEAYIDLYKEGVAMSVEVWDKNDQLVGGLYGVSINKIFYGESMFSLANNASKYALINLAKKLENENFRLIDCQVYTEHLDSMGAKFITKSDFLHTIGVQ